MKKQVDSPAIQLLRLVWKETNGATTLTWGRLNHSMASALALAINAGLRFEREDFVLIREEFGWDHWAGVDNAVNIGEGFYRAAIENGNIAACLAFEHALGRPPYFANGVDGPRRGNCLQSWHILRQRSRLALGYRFPWQGQTVTVTRFAADGTYLTACTYKEPPKEPEPCPTCGHTTYEYHRKAIARRFKITPAALQEAFPAPKNNPERDNG